MCRCELQVHTNLVKRVQSGIKFSFTHTLSNILIAPALGLESNDAAAFLAAHGWSREDDVFVAPVAAADPALQAAIVQKQKITADEVTRLAEQVLFVEQ